MRNWWLTLVSGCVVALAGPLTAVVAGMVTGRGTDVITLVPAVVTAVVCALLLIRVGLQARLGDRRAGELGAALHQQELLQRRLAYRAGHDALTGLANRDLLLERMGAGRSSGLMICGLDGFKEVNDTYGHGVGDTILRQLAGRLLLFAPEVELVARLGGDEFGFLLTGDSPDDLGERIGTAVAETPFVVDDRRIHLTLSVGSAAGAGNVLSDAALALRFAKQAGGARLVRFDESLRAAQNERTRIAAGLRQALAEGTLLMHYQPVVETRTGRITGVEALMRWRQEGKLIPPTVFIPVAEQTGLIGALGTLALRLACAQAVSWHERYAMYMTVNVSTHQLRDPGFGDEVLAILDETGLPPAALVLEITESVLIDTADTPVLGRLRSHGIRIAIDDFGTGYSSLAYLHRLPVDILKIDRSFISRHQDEMRPQDVGLTRAILDLARSQDLVAVAEGVETEAQAELLRRLDCPLAQGYHFSRPEEAEVIESLMRGRSKILAA